MYLVSAAVAFVALIGLTVAFQLALSFGKPWGHLTMGGRYPGVLPPAMRAAAILQSLVLGVLGALVLSRAGVFALPWAPLSRNGIWGAVAVSGISLVMNLASPSPPERRLWAPVALCLLLSSLAVAFLT